jgi:hypothetical protein
MYKLTATLTALILTLGFIGCTPNKTSAPTKTTKPAVKAPAVKAPVATVKAPTKAEAKLLEKIQKTEDIFELHQLKTGLADSAAGTPVVLQAIEKKYKQVLSTLEPKPINDAIELTAFKWDLLGEDPGEGKNAPFRVSCLFHKKAATSLGAAQSVFLDILGQPEASLKHFLATEKDPARARLVVRFAFDVNDWRLGEYQVFTREMDEPSLPYNFTAAFKIFEDVNGSRKYIDYYAPRLLLGWHAGLDR